VEHRLEWVDLGELRPAERNAKDHDLGLLVQSIRRFGFVAPFLVDEGTGRLVAGHGRAEALAVMRNAGEAPPRGVREQDGRWLVPVVRGLEFGSEAEALAYLVADNRATEAGGWNEAELAEVLAELEREVGLLGVGFDQEDLEELLRRLHGEAPEAGGEAPGRDAHVAPAETEDLARRWGVRPGDVWVIPSVTVEGGGHRIVCGDATDPETVAAALGGGEVRLVFADPPYGMGKEREGVENDNLAREEWAALMRGWWEAVEPHMWEYASAYVWGLPERLWWWWYQDMDARRVSFRNELVWVKPTAQGQRLDGPRTFVPQTERALFLIRGVVDRAPAKDDFREELAPILDYLVEQKRLAGWSTADVNRVLGTATMAGHFFQRSQFVVPNRAHYDRMREAAGGLAFGLTWEEMLALGGLRPAPGADTAGPGGRPEIPRGYFDNVHDAMTDVWEFSTVTGAERWGHATPKPVGLVERAVVTSCEPGGLVYDPFLGTGTTLVAAENRGRVACGVELVPDYVAVCLERLARLGLEPVREQGGDA